MRGQWCFWEWQHKPRDKRQLANEKENLSLLDHHHSPKLTPLFNPESNEEANRAIKRQRCEVSFASE